jgi:hypothetical protein
MSDQKQNEPAAPAAGMERTQNSYQKRSASQAAEHAPDIQQPGPAGDFGGGQPMPKPVPGAVHGAARPPKGKADAAHPEEAAEPSNPYAGI